MEATKSSRVAVIALHQAGHSTGNIFHQLKSIGVKRRFVYRTIKRYKETSSISDRPRSGRPRSVRTPQAIKAVRERVRRNPCRNVKKMALQMKMCPSSMSKLLKCDLGLKSLRRRQNHHLTAVLKQARARKCRILKTRHARKREKAYRRILFTDEKWFTVDQKINRQNDRVLAPSVEDIPESSRVLKVKYPAKVHVWWGVSYAGVTDIVFFPPGETVTAKNYLTDVLEGVVSRLGATMFDGEHWIFQQDSAPAHKARVIQNWLDQKVPEYISVADWPASSPDLNPLDYSLWTELENRACSKRHTSLEMLKKSIVDAAKNLPMEVVRAAIDDYPTRLRACYKAKGGHFEI